MSRSGHIPAIAAIVTAGFAVSGCMLTPKSYEPDFVGSTSSSRLFKVFAGQEPIQTEVSLYEAMARALKYNLEHKVKLAETALRVRQLDLAHHSLMPTLVAKSGYAGRNKYSGGKSKEILSSRSLGAESLQSSTSQEREVFSGDITMSWNILDFGLSYVRAQQASDEVLIARELRRKIAAKIIEDVRTVFWRALSNQRLFGKMKRLQRKVQASLASSRVLSSGGEVSPITALTYERELIEIKRELQRLQSDLLSAKAELAVLMNERPDASFRLKDDMRSAQIPQTNMDLPAMLSTALDKRPEIRELFYKARINKREVNAAALELLPGLQLFAGGNFDSNKFLYSSHWIGWGAKASWNLMKVFQYPTKRKLIGARDKLLKQKALAMSAAIYMQVHVARARYIHARRELRTAQEFANVQKRLLRQVRAGVKAGSVTEQSLIREEMNALIAQVKFDIAYASFQNSFANLFTTMGLDVYPSEASEISRLGPLTEALREMWIERGTPNFRPAAY